VEFDRLGVLVPGAALCHAFLDDLAMMQPASEDRVLSLQEAASWSGYSVSHLARLVKEGKLKTLRPSGTRGRLTFRSADLPRKPSRRHTLDAGVHELASRLFGGREGRYARS
jgi:hypothetical protein